MDRYTQRKYRERQGDKMPSNRGGRHPSFTTLLRDSTETATSRGARENLRVFARNCNTSCQLPAQSTKRSIRGPKSDCANRLNVNIIPPWLLRKYLFVASGKGFSNFIGSSKPCLSTLCSNSVTSLAVKDLVRGHDFLGKRQYEIDFLAILACADMGALRHLRTIGLHVVQGKRNNTRNSCFVSRVWNEV